jgi:hypothetical protein
MVMENDEMGVGLMAYAAGGGEHTMERTTTHRE